MKRDLSEADLSEADLSEADLSVKHDLSVKRDISEADLSVKHDLSEADLSETRPKRHTILYYLTNSIKSFHLYLYRIMNILLKHTDFNKNAIQFLETKPNMLFDGLFTKLNYCDDFMVMYGIYLDVPVETSVRPIIASDVLNQFELIERDLINEYIEHRALTNKIITNKFSDFVRSKYDIRESCSGESLAVLKISGIWENTNGEIGLSFKLLQR